MTEEEWVLDMCRQFRCLPSQLLAEDAELMRALTVEAERR